MLESLKRLLSKRAPDRYSRRWPRLSLEESAKMMLWDGRQQSVILNQLSVGGARVQSSVPLRPGENIELQFGEAQSGHHNVPARIVYSLKEPAGFHFACGLCFMGVDARQAQQIAAYIAAHQAQRRNIQPQDR